MTQQQSLATENIPSTSKQILLWFRENLFSSWFNGILTVLCLGLIYKVTAGFFTWATTQAQWAVLNVNLRLFFVGRYPPEQYWRIWLTLALLLFLSGLSWGVWGRFVRAVAIAIGAASLALATLLPVDPRSRGWILGCGALVLVGFALGQRFKRAGTWLPLLWLVSFPIILWFIGGGLGLAPVESNLWNGLLLTILIAVAGIFLSFPLGVLLALGRQSTLPVIHWFSVLYIEIIRGLPLIGILFMAQVMLPLFLPPELRIDGIVRAIAGFVLFSAAYLAENVRGGLQSVPRGQMEAANALGLSTPLTLCLIVLPQALRAVIPAIVGQFIGLFKDTSLVAIVGLVELMGISRSILAQPDFIGRYAEVYLFVALIYWLFCYSMSVGSRRLEQTPATR